MTERKLNSLLLYTLKNYASLREQLFQTESTRMQHRPKIYIILDLLQIILGLTDLLIDEKELLTERFRELNIQSKIPSISSDFDSVQKSIKNHWYKVLKKCGRSFFVELIVSGGDDTALIEIPEDQLRTLLFEHYEIIFMQTVYDRYPKHEASLMDIIKDVSYSPKSHPAVESKKPVVGKDQQPKPNTAEQVEGSEEKTREYDQHMKEIKEKYEAHKAFWDKNKARIRKERNKRPDGKGLNYTLTYRDVNENKIMYGLFHDDQQALLWAYKNVGLMEKNVPFIQIWELSDEASWKHELRTTELAVFTLELVHPLESKELISKQNALFDTGSDITSFPFQVTTAKSLINSATILNKTLTPTVYGKLGLDGEILEKIYEVDLDKDGTWCAAGIPLMRDSPKAKVREIMKKTMKKITIKKL